MNLHSLFIWLTISLDTNKYYLLTKYLTKYRFVNRSSISRSQSVTSSQLLHNFTINQLKDNSISILSVSSDKFLVSRQEFSQLFIYSSEGHHLSTITTNVNDKLCDATWTPHGNIMYTKWKSNKIVIISDSGEVITTPLKKMTKPLYISVSNDNIIYVADWETGVYQSIDDGASWSLVFKSTDGWHCYQVVKVTIDHSDDFWTLEESDTNEHLRVYNVDRRRSDGNVTWRDVNVPTTGGKHISLSHSCLLYDGKVNIFLSDYHNKAVHVFTVNGQHHCQLLSSHHFVNNPRSLALDKERQLLYVGQSGQLAGVFKLTYGIG